ncbi:hypothetical protein M988_2275 [Hafnia paralvei ATCC 29927]|uniref:hypothetical protein n=1 Tax=Hafnia paralvei TaxID=546367 RepID=UPI0007E3FEDB|nr:hypothetical protein [Hafnia paralvei]OAT41098.1 hypothetical protein M988_2275 [Hafnia paralvei ATCC 29927]
MKAYCTKNNILVTGGTSSFYKETVFSIPIDKCIDGRSKPTYYTSIAIFLQHLICSATASRNTKKRARFKGDKDWTYSVPFPYQLGHKHAAGVFKQSRELPFKRALEKLRQAGLIKIIPKDVENHKCREFALSKRFLKRLFPGKRNDYLQREDRYTYLTDIYDKRQDPQKLEDLMVQAASGTMKVKHKTSVRDIPDKAFRERVKQVYSQLEPLCINLDALRDYCNQHPTSVNMGYYHNFISHLCDVGVEIISHKPLVVAYRQSYKTAKLGGRSFENGAGYQYLPRAMKEACLGKGYNYDIRGCQLEILKHELAQRGVPLKNLERLETAYISKKLKVSEDKVKNFRFSAIFSVGSVSLAPKSSTRKYLNKALGQAEAAKVLKRWKKLMKPLKDDLNQLVDYYLTTGTRNRYGLCVKNAVGQSFNCTYKKSGKGEKRQPQQMRRKLLAHMLQGLESQAVYDFVAKQKGICALEHDGFVCRWKLDVEKDWKHPYLVIVLKN